VTEIRIKICGITTPEDARLAVEVGATHLGLNFVPRSPRFLTTLVRAKEIAGAARDAALARGHSIEVVGVFADEEMARVSEIDAVLSLEALQFHGSEPPAWIEEWGSRAWKALAVTSTGEFDETARQRFPFVAAFLLDRPRGGTGSSWDFASASARRFAAGERVWLAGGLGPDNVEAAIRAARPFGVDASSRLESAPGRKDPSLLRQFVEAVRRAEEN
jgi:phosphoribosylanthranilate isomerase